MRSRTTRDRAVLIVGPSWVGDMVMAQPLFKLLKDRDPGRAIDVLAPEWSIPIVERMPEVRCCFPSRIGHGQLALARRRHLARKLGRSEFEQAIVLPRSIKSALIPWFAGIPVRTGFLGESRYVLLNDRRVFDKTLHRQTVKRFVALGLGPEEPLPEFPNPKLGVSTENQQRLVSELSLDVAKTVIAVMPGAEYGPSKRWPVEYFAELAKRYTRAGHQVWVLGSPKDREAGDVIAATQHAVNLCGKTTLADVVDLLALCGRAVSNDSGLMHIAAAVGIHVQAIFGSTSPLLTPPMTEKKQIHVLDVDCGPCFERTCGPGHHRCMRGITPDDVMGTDPD